MIRGAARRAGSAILRGGAEARTLGDQSVASSVCTPYRATFTCSIGVITHRGHDFLANMGRSFLGTPRCVSAATSNDFENPRAPRALTLVSPESHVHPQIALLPLFTERAASVGVGESTSGSGAALLGLRSPGGHSSGAGASGAARAFGALAAVAGTALVGSVCADSPLLVSSETQRQTFFFYEKKIRSRSSQEKVFQYFASKRGEDGVPLMSAHDLVRAVVHVFQPEGAKTSRAGNLAGEPVRVDEEAEAIFARRVPAALFEVMGRGERRDDITFEEYLVLVSLWSIDPTAIGSVFALLDDDDSGMIERNELETTLQGLLMGATGRGQGGEKARAGQGMFSFKSPGAPPPEPSVNSVEAMAGVAGLMRHLFGKDGEKGATGAAKKTYINGEETASSP